MLHRPYLMYVTATHTLQHIHITPHTLTSHMHTHHTHICFPRMCTAHTHHTYCTTYYLTFSHSTTHHTHIIITHTHPIAHANQTSYSHTTHTHTIPHSHTHTPLIDIHITPDHIDTALHTTHTQSFDFIQTSAAVRAQQYPIIPRKSHRQPPGVLFLFLASLCPPCWIN